MSYMDEPIRTFLREAHFEKGVWIDGKTLKIYRDPDPVDPRREFDNLGEMICFSNRYRLGDEHNINPDDFSGWNEMGEFLENEYDAVVILPLYLYDHSGIRMSTGSFNDPWDSGQIGFIYVSRATIIHEYGKCTQDTIETATRVLVGEVDTYNNYLSGEVYGFNVEDAAGEIIDSCWGYFGDISYILSDTGFTEEEEV